ncbi:osteocrin [Archocentrus centrarchus]|uniref:osteocrin n=1 Tax=Archocentrus centrarchus TaxID=63155 RepID=UPI0011EA48AA|nr:osteocrin [Archocentrus centrarchus]
MQFCFCLLLPCLLAFTLLRCSVDGFRVQPAQQVDRPMLRFHTARQPRPAGVKVGEELTAKLLLLDHEMRMENDVMEPKRKRSFPVNNIPLDRLSISSMETKQGSNKQSKVVESPRRRLNPPPIDRIGMGRLPNSRG